MTTPYDEPAVPPGAAGSIAPGDAAAIEPADPAPGADPAAAPADPDTARLTAWVRGRVQGVGFRWWTRSRALELGLAGKATNLDDGRVEVVAEGPREACERLLAHLRSGRTPGSVDSVTERWSVPRGGLSGFVER